MECPLLNNSKLKKKSIVATWNNSDEESTEEDQAHEMSNLALMVIGDELDEVNDLPYYDELLETFKELHSDIKKFGFKKASPEENFITQVKMIIYKSKIVL